jgi:hypothetical protein
VHRGAVPAENPILWESRLLPRGVLIRLVPLPSSGMGTAVPVWAPPIAGQADGVPICLRSWGRTVEQPVRWKAAASVCEAGMTTQELGSIGEFVGALSVLLSLVCLAYRINHAELLYVVRGGRFNGWMQHLLFTSRIRR